MNNKGKNKIFYFVKSFKHKSLLVKNFTLILLLMVIPFNLLTYWFYLDTQKKTFQEISTTNIALVSTIKDIMDNLIGEITLFSINTTLQKDIVNYILSNPFPGHFSQTRANINQYIKNYIYTHEYIDSVYIYHENNNIIFSNTGEKHLQSFEDQNWINDYNRIDDNKTSVTSRKKNDSYPFFITIIHPISISKNEKIGCVAVNIDILKLISVIDNSYNLLSQKICIADNTLKIIYNKDRNLIGQNIFSDPMLKPLSIQTTQYSQKVKSDNSEYIVSHCFAQKLGWHYYLSMSSEHYYNLMHTNTEKTVFILIFTILISIVISFLVSIHTFKPVKNIISVLQNPNEYYNNTLSMPISDEMSLIINRIAEKTNTVNELESELARRLVLLNQSQTIALQAQINPHFLYNTLENINWTAIKLLGKDNKVSNMIVFLADFYKLYADTNNYLATLSDEISYSIRYIKILMLRHNAQFSVDWNIDPSLANCKIARLCLQPIIENAVYHGLKAKNFYGNISISTHISEDDFIISITDDGIGMESSDVDDINQKMNENFIASDKHIGIKNVNQRIKMIFGDKYGITIESNLGLGTKINIRYPITQDSQNVN